MGVRGEELRERGIAHPVRGVRRQERIARHAVEERDAKEKDGGTEGAQDQVLEPRLERGRARAEIADEDVESDRERLERDEEHHEIVALDEEHHRGGHHQDDDVEFQGRRRAARQVHPGEQEDQDRGEEEEDAHRLAAERGMEQAVEHRDAEIGGMEMKQHPREHHDFPEDGHGRDRQAGALRQHDFQDEEEERQAAQRQLGADGAPRVAGGELLEEGEVHGGRAVTGRSPAPWRRDTRRRSP